MVGTVINNRYKIIKKIDEGGISTVFLAQDQFENKEIVVRTLRKEQLSSRLEDIIRFKNEANLIAQLNHPNIVKLLSIGEISHTHYLVMEYIRGQSLYKLIEKRHQFTITETVHIIKEIVKALTYIHNRNIIHRDLKPGNIMLTKNNRGRSQIKLIDFGLALLKEYKQTSRHPEIVGTFSYMAPEQFGIIAREVDERSDLYSMGVLFYQLLTGQLPFKNNDVNSIIHYQLANFPLLPTELNKNIPKILEKIILKLLQKDPSLRYQSAKGILYDLDKFSSGEQNFVIGSRDIAKKMSFRSSLIGREDQVKTIKDLFHKALNGAGNICLIGGQAGIGKTRLVEELRDYVFTLKGIFIGGKCFSGNNKIPYGPFKDALNTYIKIFNRYNETKKAEIQAALKEATGDLSGIVTQFYPILKEIIGESPPVTNLEKDRESKRFLMVISSFLIALSKVENGLVLFLDDLHWSDKGSLDLLNELMYDLTNDVSLPIFIVGTYRNDELTEQHSLTHLIHEYTKTKLPFTKVQLDLFDQEKMEAFIREILHEPKRKITRITELVLLKTRGNPFFALELLKNLIIEQALIQKNQRWTIDEKIYASKEIPSEVLDILLHKISLLDPPSQVLLSYAAVIGRKFDSDLLFKIYTKHLARNLPKNVTNPADTEIHQINDVLTIIDKAVKLQLVEEHKGNIIFAHDKIREAFYQDIGEEKRQVLHNSVGLLLEQIHQDNPDKVLFDLAHHFLEGKNPGKILQYALPAGKKAKENYAHSEAIKYLTESLKIIEPQPESHNKQWITIQKDLNEIYLIIGNYNQTIELANKLLPYINNNYDQALFNYHLCQSIFKQGDYDNCEKFGRIGLRLLGKNLAKNPSLIVAGICWELLIHVSQCFFPQNNTSANAKKHEKRHKLMVDFYYLIAWLYRLNNTLKFIWLGLKTLNHAQLHLNQSRELGKALVGYSTFCLTIPLFNRALKYAQKAADLFHRIQDSWGQAIALTNLGMCSEFKGNYKHAIDFYQKSHKILSQVGDIKETMRTFSMRAVNYYLLADYQNCIRANEAYNNISCKARDNFGKINSYIISMQYLNEMGDYEKSLYFGTTVTNELHKKNILLLDCDVNIQLGICYLEQEQFDKAIKHLNKAKQINEANHFIKPYTVYVYANLAEACLEDFLYQQETHTFTNNEAKQKLQKLKQMCDQALKYTKPWISFHGAALRVSARFYWIRGKRNQAEKLFIQSINLNQKLNRRYEWAKAHYSYGKCLNTDLRFTPGKIQLEKALAIFKDIGAKEYEKRTEQLLGIEKTTKRENVVLRLKEQKRMESIFKVSQSISSILNLDILLEKIIAVAIEITGAQRGFLFMGDDEKGKLNLITHLNIKNKSDKQDTSPSKNVFSQNIINQVYQSGEVVLTTNALEDNKLEGFKSVFDYNLKSILCIPIKYKNKVKGVCYLDNPLSHNVFSADDIDTLNTIMLQAAISIENAKLFEHIQYYKNKAEEEIEKLTVYISQHEEKHTIDESNTLVYKSKAIRGVLEKVAQANKSQKPVLITGETGTGKELIARMIENPNQKTKGSTIAINCATIPDTLWESEVFGHCQGSFTNANSDRMGSIAEAEDGIVIFDEIGEIPIHIQAKLLRLLQENTYKKIGENKIRQANCRFVFVTNRDIEQMISQGGFRDDLFYRMNVFHIIIPPLRERKEDIPVLINHFLLKYAPEFNLVVTDIQKNVIQSFLDYYWPGNIRELENLMIRSLAILSGHAMKKDSAILTTQDIPASFFAKMQNSHSPVPSIAPNDTLQEEIILNKNYQQLISNYSKKIISLALDRAKGNKTQAAKLLGIKRTTLTYKMKELQLK